MKKYILIMLIFLNINSLYAINIEYNEPIFDDINEYLTTWDIEPGYNPQPVDRIWIYEPYESQGVALLTAIAYCNVKGETYINYILENQKIDSESVLYYPLSLTWWNHDKKILRFAVITCDNWSISTDTGTGTTFIVNNINDDEGINKEIFDIETITEIYQYEALIMVFILSYTFFMRVIGARRKKAL